MATIERKTKRYPTDLTDAEWEWIVPLLPTPAKRGRRPGVEMREVLNAIRYMTRSGGGWRMLPKDFPPPGQARGRLWQTVYWWFRRFVRLMLFQTIHDIALMMDRERRGREASPSGGVLDSQTVKAPAPGAKRGFDAGKKTVGRKRHIAVDTDGRLLMVNLTSADISDSAGAQMILDAVRKRWPWFKHLFTDGAYDRTQLMDKAAFQEFVIEVVRRIDKEPGFKVPPRRWVVERTFGCLTRWRRLVARLRAAHRRIRSHDPRRDEQPSAATDQPLSAFSNGLYWDKCATRSEMRPETTNALCRVSQYPVSSALCACNAR